MACWCWQSFGLAASCGTRLWCVPPAVCLFVQTEVDCPTAQGETLLEGVAVVERGGPSGILCGCCNTVRWRDVCWEQ